MTPLDKTHASLQITEDDEQSYLTFYSCLVETELFVLLDHAPDGDAITPSVIEIDRIKYVLGFDTLDRLTDFSTKTSAYAAFYGRDLIPLLASEALGLALNPEVAQSAELLSPETLIWLADFIRTHPNPIDEQISGVSPPQGLSEGIITSISGKLSHAYGLAICAYIVGVHYVSGNTAHLIAFVGAKPEAESSLSSMMSEALAFSGFSSTLLDVGFFAEDHPIIAALERHGLKINFPQKEPFQSLAVNIGLDPQRPPKLK